MTYEIKHRHSRARAILSVLFIFLVAVSFGVRGHAAKGDLETISEMKKAQNLDNLNVIQGMAEVVDVGGSVSDVMVADPSVVDVMALQANRLYVVGASIGTTNIIALDENGDVLRKIKVNVQLDTQSIQEMVDSLFPNEDVMIRALTDQVVLTGHVSTPAVAGQISNLVASHVAELQGTSFNSYDEVINNMMTVAGEHQVMLKVKIVEASRNVLRELGVETDVFEGSGDAGALTSETVSAASSLTADPLGVGTLLYNAGRDGTGGVQLTVRALEQDGLVNTLAEPNLTAISGESAGFLAGGDFPVPTSRDDEGNVIVTYRPFGVSLNFVPTVMSSDVISLNLSTEVSSISSQNSLVTNDLSIPGFNVRRADTTVELASGGSIVIAGLLQSEVTKNMNDLPGIKDVPILGDLISSESFQRDETELLVIVTAYLVKPYADKTVADEAPEEKQERTALSTLFAANLRRTYGGMDLPEDLLNENGAYGYLID